MMKQSLKVSVLKKRIKYSEMLDLKNIEKAIDQEIDSMTQNELQDWLYGAAKKQAMAFLSVPSRLVRVTYSTSSSETHPDQSYCNAS